MHSHEHWHESAGAQALSQDGASRKRRSASTSTSIGLALAWLLGAQLAAAGSGPSHHHSAPAPVSRHAVKKTASKAATALLTSEAGALPAAAKVKRCRQLTALPGKLSSIEPHHPATAKHSTAPGEPVAEPSEYSSQSKIYTLYDQGINARLAGDYHTAVSRLAEVAELLKESHLSPTMAAMTQYELARAAESDNQPRVAIDAYGRSLKLNPRDTTSAIHLSELLLRVGQPALALVRARDAVQRSPNDAQAHLALSVALQHNGFSSDAKLERERARQLITGIGKVQEPAQPIDEAPKGSQTAEESQPFAQGGSPVPGSNPEGPLNDALTPETIPSGVP